MSGLMNFKTKYEDSTQSKTKSPVTIAQSTAAPSQLIQPSSQQPVAVPQMIAKQRNDSMSSKLAKLIPTFLKTLLNHLNITTSFFRCSTWLSAGACCSLPVIQEMPQY